MKHLKKIVTAICALVMILSLAPAAFAASSRQKWEPSVSGPSVEDVRAFGSEITYPKRSSYLDSYETMYVKSTKGHSIYVFWKANGDMAYLRGNFYFIPEATEVTVLARQGQFSCVVYNTQDGNQHIGWVSTPLLVYDYY